jgi:L-methionine (R)-S-oxide reductase
VHSVNVLAVNKEEKYLELLPQIEALISHETNLIANLANICAALKFNFNWLWVGFYLVADNELVLGPFQGPVACTRIKKGQGVCGASWQENRTLVVANVHEFPGHIACSSLSNSEIVVPVYDNTKKFLGVLDIDSEELNHFDEVDLKYLEQLVNKLF